MVHTFTCLGLDFCLDVESGSLFQIDELAKILLEQHNSPLINSTGEFSRFSNEEQSQQLSRFSAEQIAQAKEELDKLKKENQLFVPPFNYVPPKTGGVVKAMCLNICHNCNLACAYCFADEGKYNGQKGSMTVDVAKKALDFLVQNSNGRTNLEVDFFGGEPLMNLDVVKKTVEYGRELQKSTKKNFRFTITTNALNLNDDTIDFFNKEMYNVVISIDGRKNVHNSVRKTAGGADSFDIVLKNALNFKSKRGDKQYYIRGTFTSLNKDFALDALALNDYGFDQISLEPVVLPDNHELAFKETDIEDLCEQYETLAAEYLKRRQTDKWFNFFHFTVDLEGGPCEHKRHASCGAGTEYVAVTPEGEIYPCHQFVGNKEFLQGNILDGKINGQVRDYFYQNNIAFKGECKDCFAKYFCSGGCAANAVNFNSDILKPYKTACALMKKRLECALAIYSIENESQNP